MEKYKKGRHCKKCGEKDARTSYISMFGIEYIERVCRNCGYKWHEKPLNKAV